jgi:hypothetical protein
MQVKTMKRLASGYSFSVASINRTNGYTAYFKAPGFELLGEGHIEDLVMLRLETPQSRALEKKREHHDGHDGCTPSGS